MPLSDEVRRLQARWQMGTGWPKNLEWIEIDRVRGWSGQRFALQFPLMVVVGENGSGKSTVLQAAASVYTPDPPKTKFRFASDFFPDTPWDQIRGAEIRYAVREGEREYVSSIRKPTGRWRGNPERRRRNVEYIDLSRVQPVPARVGYRTLANPAHREIRSSAFDDKRVERLSAIMGRKYELARMALTDADPNRNVPILSFAGASYSGFHQGAGETTVTELLQSDLPKNSLVLIDEIESSLHPRAQRRLIRDLATKCRENELQIILTTHSPYVVEELPLEARAYILTPTEASPRAIVYGVSPDFAMSKMDDRPHFEVDLYVEDARAATMVTEILTSADPDLALKVQTIPYGAASVGQVLGQMNADNRFPRPTSVFLDGDRGEAPGCLLLPGEDAPERVVFNDLQKKAWGQLHQRIGRDYPSVADCCLRAMTSADHHKWLDDAARGLVLSTDTLWQAMCAEWAVGILDHDEAQRLASAVADQITNVREITRGRVATPRSAPVKKKPRDSSGATEQQLPLD